MYTFRILGHSLHVLLKPFCDFSLAMDGASHLRVDISHHRETVKNVGLQLSFTACTFLAP